MNARLTIFAAAAFFLLTAPGIAQQPAGEIVPARHLVAGRAGNVIRVNGIPTVLTWARGVRDPADLDSYAALGLNTVYVVILGSSQDELAQASALISAAEERGLMVVGALAPPTVGLERGQSLAADPRSDAYVSAVQGFVETVVEALGDHPGLVGWAVEAVLPETVVWSDAAFQAYLQDWYTSVGDLNDSWGTEYSAWEEISVGSYGDVDTALPYGVGRASVDYAYFRESVYAAALSVWASALRAADRNRLVFAAGLADYRSIISVRPDFDGLVLTTYPSAAEADWQTHNVHAVDIARRANQFAAVQTLEVAGATTPQQLIAWAGLALAHGAAGVAFSSWNAVRDSEPLQGAVSEIAQIAIGDGLPAEPFAQTAVLYQPFVGGALRNGRGLYGYLDGMVPNEPTTLFGVARFGTRYGVLDVLTLDSFEYVDLSQYGAIIAPMALYLPQDAQLTLQNYVIHGGSLVVDLGAGMYQAEGVVTSMPAMLRDMLGMRYADVTDAQRQELQAQFYGPPGVGIGPEVEVGDVYDPAEPTQVVPIGPGTTGEEIDPALVRFVQGLEEFLTRPDVSEFLGDSFLGEAGAGLRVRGMGGGFSVYAPTPLYESWDASDPAFNEFHARILSRGSDLEVVEPTGIWPGVTVTAYPDWSVCVSSPNGAPTSVLVYDGGNQVYAVPGGAVRLGNPEEENRLELLFPGASLAVARPLPIYVYPAGEGAVASVSVLRYDREGVELMVHGTGAQPRVGAEGVEFVGGVSTPVEIEVKGGRYRVASGSTHRVVVEQGAGGRWASEQEMMPNPETGSLVIRDTFPSARIIVTPIGY